MSQVMGFSRMAWIALVAVAAGWSVLSELRAQDGAGTSPQPDDSAAEARGWLLGTQTYTFNRFTFFEALDKAHSVGLKYVEAYPGQKISADIDGTMGPGMTAEQIAAVKQKLAQLGIRVTAFGVVGLSADEAESRKTFEWCRTMGVMVINTEVEASAFDTLEKLCQEFQIKVGLHNHPKPSIYWNPDTIVEALRGRSPWLGACADTGHWLRSDLDPVASLKKLEGRIVSMHFKDLNKRGSGAHDVPWGEGVGNVPAILQELQRQKFKGPISVEYEHNWLNSLPEVGQCVQNFHRLTGELK
jgi:sugar phosphate isomerase/epimerase